MDMAQEKGASAWLTAIPRADYDFALHKVISGSHCAFDTNGHHLDCPHNVLVGRASVSHMPWTVQGEDFQASATTSFVT